MQLQGWQGFEVHGKSLLSCVTCINWERILVENCKVKCTQVVRWVLWCMRVYVGETWLTKVELEVKLDRAERVRSDVCERLRWKKGRKCWAKRIVEIGTSHVGSWLVMLTF